MLYPDKHCRISVAAALMAAFSGTANANDQAHDIYMRYPGITGPFNTNAECVNGALKKMLGNDAVIVFSDDPELYEEIEIKAHSRHKEKNIFVTMNDENVVELGVNLSWKNPEYYGWANLYYGEKTSVLKVGGARPLTPEAMERIRDFTLQVDYNMRYCGGGAASAGPAFIAG